MRNLQADHDAYIELEARFWPDGPACPHCGSDRAYFIEAANGQSRRKTSSHRRCSLTADESVRRLWKCRSCRRQFSVLTGTPLHGSKVPASKIIEAIDLLQVNQWLTARRLAELVGITPGSAYFLRLRIRALSDSS